MALLDHSLDHKRDSFPRGWIVLGLAVAAWGAIFALGWSVYALVRALTG